MKSEIPYLQEIGDTALSQNAHRLEEIKSAIREKGYWQEENEWRISTVTTSRIEPELLNEKWWFKVTVSCDQELSCHAPTLERALQFMGVFNRLTMDIMWNLGWSSWASSSRLEPEPGETVPGPLMV